MTKSNITKYMKEENKLIIIIIIKRVRIFSNKGNTKQPVLFENAWSLYLSIQVIYLCSVHL